VRSDAGQPSPFLVGRDAELGQIEAAVDNVARRGGTVRLAGDPGVGKSALLRAGAELAKERGCTALEQILDMIVAIATIHGDTGYTGPILQAALDGLRPPATG
jgi:hypothetical protein